MPVFCCAERKTMSRLTLLSSIFVTIAALGTFIMPLDMFVNGANAFIVLEHLMPCVICCFMAAIFWVGHFEIKKIEKGNL